MKLARVLLPNEQTHVAVVEAEAVRVLDMTQVESCRSLSDILHAPDPVGLAKYLIHADIAPVAIEEVQFLPVDRQEVWAAGVTYKLQPAGTHGRIRAWCLALRPGLHGGSSRTVFQVDGIPSGGTRGSGPGSERQPVVGSRNRSWHYFCRPT
ncbi:MAG: hypothetical protein R3C12_17980 [Planctomycetaceae bacterium]